MYVSRTETALSTRIVHRLNIAKADHASAAVAVAVVVVIAIQATTIPATQNHVNTLMNAIPATGAMTAVNATQSRFAAAFPFLTPIPIYFLPQRSSGRLPRPTQ